MSEGDVLAVFRAMDKMKRTGWGEGTGLYGPRFKPWDYFVQRHALAVVDPRGDQAHGGPAFMTWHRLFLLEFEDALLAVNRSIGALPYWDSTAPNAMDIFGEKDTQLGSTVGGGAQHDVTDGFFRHWRVGMFNETLAAEHGGSTWRGNSHGELRTTEPLTPGIVRFPRCEQYQTNRTDWLRCATTSGNWTQWYRCMMTPHDALDIRAGFRDNIRLSQVGTGALHFEGHLWLGSQRSPGYGCATSDPFSNPGVVGDFWDHVTSPNDPVFYFYHASLDRINMHYMRLNQQQQAGRYYGFPTTNGTKHADNEGTLLLDVAASHWPYHLADFGDEFKAEFGTSRPHGPLTHADVLCWLSPRAAHYMYI